MQKHFILIIAFSFIAFSCGFDIVQDQEWNINKNEIEKGLGNADDIPSLRNPQYNIISDVDYMEDDDLVIIADVEGTVKIYPVKILVYHEIINETNESIIYCTLTGTSNMFRRIIDGVRLDLGVSGYVHNNNLLIYDQTTNSFWSQMLAKSVTGQYIDTEMDHTNVIETTWATAKSAYPTAIVLSNETGFARDYNVYPYDDYRTDSDLIFPLDSIYIDDRLLNKNKVLGILGDSTALAYNYFNIPDTGMYFFEDTLEDENIIVIGSNEYNILVAFNSEPGVTYSIVENQLPVIFNDSNGNEYDFLGRVISGPDTGSTLSAPRTMTGYWFIFPAFYSNIQIR